MKEKPRTMQQLADDITALRSRVAQQERELEDLVTFTLAGSAVRLLREGSPDPRVMETVRNATRAKHGRGFRFTFTTDRTTAELTADYLASVADVVGDMTATEREGGTEHTTARAAVARIESALANNNERGHSV